MNPTFNPRGEFLKKNVFLTNIDISRTAYEAAKISGNMEDLKSALIVLISSLESARNLGTESLAEIGGKAKQMEFTVNDKEIAALTGELKQLLGMDPGVQI